MSNCNVICDSTFPLYTSAGITPSNITMLFRSYSGEMHIIMLLVSGVSKLKGGSGQWVKVALLKKNLIHVKTYVEIHE